MRKFLLVAATGLLALIVGGCGGGSGGDKASPSPSPGASPPSPAAKAPTPAAKASATPGASPSPTTVAQAFPSPVVTPQSRTAVSDTGLTQSTNPDERARQAQSDINRKQKSSPLKPQPRQVEVPAPSAASDPFSVLPPQTVKNSPEGGGGTPEPPSGLSESKIPNILKLPEYKNPTQWKPGSGIPPLPAQQGTEVSSIPPLPIDISRPQWKPLPGSRPGQPRPPSFPQGNPTEVSGLPQLPIDINRPQWRPGSPITSSPGGRGQTPISNRPPSLPTASPQQLPDIPKVAITPPPSWRDPNPPPAPAVRPGPPPPPSTDIAEAIEVSGVVKVGNEIFVIVKAASEATSRYVKVGQRIANGQVLIKRVVFRPGQDPVVILEQNGVEVSKTVGELSPQASKQPG